MFSGQPRLIIFNCPSNVDPSYIADSLRDKAEYVYNLGDASQEMGLYTQYVDISYKPRRVIGSRTPKYRYFKK